MSATMHQYFKENDLFAPGKLEQFCEHHGVQLRRHPEHKRLSLLSYSDAVQRHVIPWDNFNRRCRGLVVDTECKLIAAHPYDKFYNLDEENETKYNTLVKKSGVFRAVEKLDGSLIILFWDAPTCQWIPTTRGEWETEYAKAARGYLPKAFLDKGAPMYPDTIMCELIDPKLANVIDYRKLGYEPGLYLLGARRSRNDLLYPELQVEDVAERYGFHRPKTYAFSTLDEVIAKAKDMPMSEEGFVLRWDDGTMAKVKSPAYLRAHRIIWQYTDDRVLELLELGDEDTLKQCLESVPEEYAKELQAVIGQAKKARKLTVDMAYVMFNAAPKETRKDFALWVNKNVPQGFRRFLFSLMDGKTLEEKDVYAAFRKEVLPWREKAVKEEPCAEA